MATEPRPVIQPDPYAYDFASEEEALRASAPGSLEFLGLARRGVGFLADLLFKTPPPERTDEPTADFYRQIALFQLGALAVRSGLAVVTLVTHGYEPEAHGPKRRLSEAFTRGQSVIGDMSGEHARRWIEGRDAGSPARIAQKHGVSDAYRFLSQSSHADSAGIRFISIPPGWIQSEPDESFISLKPSRFPRHANPLLWETAYETVGFAGLLAEAFEVSVEIPGLLSAGLLAGKERFLDASDVNAERDAT